MRRGIDDPAERLRHEVPPGGPRDVDRTHDMHLPKPREGLAAGLKEIAFRHENSGVVHDDVDTPETIDGPSDCSRGARFARDAVEIRQRASAAGADLLDDAFGGPLVPAFPAQADAGI